jgi:hypothetical protein
MTYTATIKVVSKDIKSSQQNFDELHKTIVNIAKGGLAKKLRDLSGFGKDEDYDCKIYLTSDVG